MYNKEKKEYVILHMLYIRDVKLNNLDYYMGDI